MTVFKNLRLYHGETRLDTDLTAVSLEWGAETVEDTVFNLGTRSMEGGLLTLTAGYEGLYTVSTGSAASEEILFGDVGSTGVPITMSATTGGTGQECYFSQYVYTEFSHGGSVGDQHTFSGSAITDGEPLTRGFILAEKSVTATETSTGVTISAASTGQKLRGVLHVISSSGTGDQTLDVSIQSDSTSGFSSPTTRLSFDQATTSATFDFGSTAGAITDTEYRANFTVGGSSNPGFTVLVAAGVF